MRTLWIAIGILATVGVVAGGPDAYALTIAEPLIGPISGRLIDATSRQPIAGATLRDSGVDLLLCDDSGGCNTSVAGASIGPDGRFRINPRELESPLRPGTYAIAYRAEQYEQGQTAPFSLAAGQGRRLLDIAVQPFPVRLLNQSVCGPLPAGSRACRYALRVINGRNTAVSLRVWSSVQARFAAPPYSSDFLPHMAQRIHLRPGASRVVPFAFELPRQGMPATSICTEFYVAEDAESFAFTAFHRRAGFCLAPDDAEGYRVTDAAEQVSAPAPATISGQAAEAQAGQPLIGSISGRLVDALSGEPLSGAQVWPGGLRLLACDAAGSCPQYERRGFPDVAADGSFRFDGQAGGLAAGSYALSYFATQYIQAQTAPFSVAEGEHYALGDIAIQPEPLQLLDVQPCAPLPPSGGTCRYAVRIANRQDKTIALRVWSALKSEYVTPYLFSIYQAPGAQRVRLRPGESRVVSFAFEVTERVAPFTTICPTFQAANDARGFYLNPLKQRPGFCLIRGDENGFIPVGYYWQGP